MGEPTIDLGGGRCLARLSIIDVRLDEPMDTFTRVFDPAVDQSLAEALATWIHHCTIAAFTPRI